jgi:hypothetical protein
MPVAWAEASKQVTFSGTSTGLEKQLGRKPTAVQEYLQKIYK